MPPRPRRARWRRRLIRATLCLLLGAVTAVGVAWAATQADWPLGHKEHAFIGQWPASFQCGEESSAWRTVRTVSTSNACLDPVDLQSRITQRKIRAASAHVMEIASQGDELPTLAQEAVTDPNVLLDGAWRRTSLARRMLAGGWGALPEKDGMLFAHAFGWPARCLWGYSESFDAGGGRDRGWIIIIDRRWRIALGLPTIPAPAGIAFNTAFYAIPWWILLTTPGAIRRWRRKRRGTCVACGYDLRGLAEEAKCPECGT